MSWAPPVATSASQVVAQGDSVAAAQAAAGLSLRSRSPSWSALSDHHRDFAGSPCLSHAAVRRSWCAVSKPDRGAAMSAVLTGHLVPQATAARARRGPASVGTWDGADGPMGALANRVRSADASWMLATGTAAMEAEVMAAVSAACFAHGAWAMRAARDVGVRRGGLACDGSSSSVEPPAGAQERGGEATTGLKTPSDVVVNARVHVARASECRGGVSCAHVSG